MSKPGWLHCLLIPCLAAPLAWAADDADKPHKSAKTAQEAQSPATPAFQPFDYARLEQQAKTLAGQAYAADQSGLPEFLSNLNYEQYREIRYKPEKGLWRDEGLPYQIQFFHRGYNYKNRVNVDWVDQGKVTRVEYSADVFDFGRIVVPSPTPQGLFSDLGFAGVSIRYPLRHDGNYDEIVAFLGASGLRAAGLGQTQGVSARGLTVDTGLAKAEEIPVFREFWLEKPAKNSESLTVYALLDSESVTGAYRFVIHPGLEMSMEVTGHLFFRKAVERLGIAPLNSMYFHGENTERPFDDYRPEVHESDGLLMNRNNGEWVWRPLNNPRQLRISVFHEDKPQGFSLVQRDRNFDHYQDMDERYQNRSNAWVETLGDWGPGALYLIEIPSDAEKYDNIFAFWMPDHFMLTPEHPSAKGRSKDKEKEKDNVKGEFNFKYRLHYQLTEPPDAADKAKAESTRIGAGGPADPEGSSRRFVVDFKGDALKLFSETAPVEAEVGASSGKIKEHPTVRKNLETGTWRLSFELLPDKDNKDPVELRARLKLGGEFLSETWIYQWSGK